MVQRFVAGRAARGLRTLLRLRRQQDIRRLRGKLAWEGDLDKLRLDQ